MKINRRYLLLYGITYSVAFVGALLIGILFTLGYMATPLKDVMPEYVLKIMCTAAEFLVIYSVDPLRNRAWWRWLRRKIIR